MADGWVLLDKPTGITSRRAAGRIARMFGAKSFGHMGTLDPMATGLIPIALGQATKMIPYLEQCVQSRNVKEYEFSVNWGYSTDTLDITGKEVERDNKCPCFLDIEKFVSEYGGGIEQIPPAFSAIHINGRRAYELARAGIVPEMKPRHVTIYELIMTDWNAEIMTQSEFLVKCSQGTYVRSLARDIGRGAGGFLCTVSKIRRIKTNGFSINDAVSLENLEKMYNNDTDSFMGALRPVDFGLDDIPVLNLYDADTKLFKNGGFISVDGESNGRRRVYSADKFIGIGKIDNSVLKPERMLI